MNIIFAGTPEFALPSLQHLAEAPGHRILAVVTQPDRPRGRHLHHAQPPPVKQMAERLGLKVIQTADVNDPAILRKLRELGPDLIVVVAFGQKLSPEFLEIPKIECVNLHASLLPKYRGAAPVIWAIVNGEKVTGVTAQRIVYEWDAGEIISQEVIEIGPDETAGELEQRLSRVAGGLLTKVLNAYERSNVRYTPQQASQVSYAPRVRKEDGRIDWRQPAERVHNFIRGMNPRPGAFSFLPAQDDQPARRLILLRSRLEAGGGPKGTFEPGTILSTSERGIQVAALGGSLWITQLQQEGGRRMSAQEYLRGHYLREGQRFE